MLARGGLLSGAWDMEDGRAPATSAQNLQLYLSRLFLPLDDGVLSADPSAEGRAWLTAHLGPARVWAVSRPYLLAQIKLRHDAQLLDEAVFGLERRLPELSARTVITPTQKVILSALGACLFGALLLEAEVALRALMVVLSLAFGLASAFRAFLALSASFRKPVVLVQSDASLPSYTILVPMYREAAVLPALVRGLGELDYPGMLALMPQTQRIRGLAEI